MELELETQTIDDRELGTKRITGWRIGTVSTITGPPDRADPRPKDRWSVSTVWKLRDGSYVLIRESYSKIYHAEPTFCRTATGLFSGEPVTVAEMESELDATLGLALSDAVSCPDCEPPYPEELQPEEVIRYEFVRRSIDQCAYRDQVVRKLTRSRGSSGTISTVVPGASRALLEQCRRNDPDWTPDGMPVELIG